MLKFHYLNKKYALLTCWINEGYILYGVSQVGIFSDKIHKLKVGKQDNKKKYKKTQKFQIKHSKCVLDKIFGRNTLPMVTVNEYYEVLVTIVDYLVNNCINSHAHLRNSSIPQL